MGQYKVRIDIDWQFGFLIWWDKEYFFDIKILCFDISIGLTEHAHGVLFFGKEF